MKLRNLALVCAALPLYAAHPSLLLDSAGIQRLKQRNAVPASYDTTSKIELPPRGGNWFHWYVCPRHGIRLTTGKRIGAWEWEHICPVDKEVLHGDRSRPQTDFDGCALSGTHDRYARAVRDGG